VVVAGVMEGETGRVGLDKVFRWRADSGAR
jgi:hypothetical protein